MHEHIEPSKIGLDLRNERINLPTLSKIDVIRAMQTIVRQPFTRHIGAQIRDSHARALARERLDDPAPDSLRAARHQHGSAFESACHTGYRVTLSTCACAPTGKFDKASKRLP